MSSAPDYAALLKLLPVLRNWVDATGEVTLTDEEAERVRSLGFTDARAGRYRFRPFPYELVADTLFEFLSIGWDSRQVWSNSHRTAAPPATPQTRPEIRDLPSQSLGSGKVHHAKEGDHPRPQPPASEKPPETEEGREAEEARKAEVVWVARKIAKAVRKGGGRLAKRRAQQRLSRHRGIFKEALKELTSRGLVVVEGPMIVEVSRVMQAPSGTLRASPEIVL